MVKKKIEDLAKLPEIEPEIELVKNAESTTELKPEVANEKSAIDLRREQVAQVKPNGKFQVTAVDGGFVVVGPLGQVVSPLNPPLPNGEANKLASVFNAKMPKGK